MVNGTVFRANRDSDFVRIRSILPSNASFTMRLKLSRLRMDKPETPSSVYIPAKTQSGCCRIYSVKYSCYDWRLFSWASFTVDTLT